MRIDRKEILLDDEELGCSLCFYENVQEAGFDFEKNFSLDQEIASNGAYLSLNRTYGEDEFDLDYYYMEVSEFEKSCKLENLKVLC